MTAPLRKDAAIRFTEGGQDYLHYLGSTLRDVTPSRPQRVHSFESADLTTIRRVAIGSGVDEVTATLAYDGSPNALLELLAAGRRGASLEYFPSLANPSESYPLVLMDASDPVPDPDFWWDSRYRATARFRRIDGGSLQGILTQPLFYYKAGNPLPGLTHARSGAVGPYVDEDGALQDAAANIFRTTWIDGVPKLLLGRAGTNLVDEDDLTSWSTIGTPVVTALSGGMYTVEDADGGAVEAISRAVTFTGDAVKGIAFVVRENDLDTATHHTLMLRDTTAAATRLQLEITAWVSGRPTVSAVTGVHLGSVPIGDGRWVVFGQTTSVTAANSHEARIYPTDPSLTGETAKIDVGQVNAFNALAPIYPILDASESVNADSFYATWPHAPQVMTIYLDLLEINAHPPATASSGIFHIGSSSGGTGPRFFVYNNQNGSGYTVAYDDGVTAPSVQYSTAQPDVGERVELRLVLEFDDDGFATLTIGQSIDGGAEGTATSGLTAAKLKGAWAGARVYLNSLGSGNVGLAAIDSVKALPGVRTMAEMRAL